MLFTSVTVAVVALLAFGSTSVIAHGTNDQTKIVVAPLPAHDSVAVLRRYFEHNEYTAREIMDEYKLFRREKPRGTKKKSKHRTASNSPVRQSKSDVALGTVDAVMGQTDNVVKLAGAAAQFRSGGSSGAVDNTAASSMGSTDDTLR